jgi:2-methylisocitrate lyase-like PEP mutase family enzyme
MKSDFNEFNALHQVKELLVLPNAWDAKSAQMLQDCGFPAVGTSSAAVAAGLGYADGEGMPFEDYLFVIKRISASIHLPLTVDLEMGYGRTREDVYSNVQKLLDLGVAGINLEDSIIVNSNRILGNADDFARTVSFLKDKLIATSQSLFINARCDTYLLQLKDARQETTRRSKIYEAAGADGLFLPLITEDADIEAAVAATRLPINVMCIPGLPDFGRLQTLGVKRASMGPFLQNKIFSVAGDLVKKILADGSFSSIL